MSAKQVVLRSLLLVALATTASVAAKADTLDFSITGHGTDITFSLPSSPTPSSVSLFNGDFELSNIVLDVNGTDHTENLFFYLGGLFGGGAATSSSLLDLYGPQLFTGSLFDPTFKTGDFTVTTSPGFEGWCDQGNYNLDITDQGPPSMTPEPSSVMLLATGVLALLVLAAVKRNAGLGGIR